MYLSVSSDLITCGTIIINHLCFFVFVVIGKLVNEYYANIGI